MKQFQYALLPFLAIACGGETPEPATPATTTEEAPAQPQALPGQDPAAGNIQISDRIREACGITDAQAHFAYNSASLSSEQSDLFKKLADCFSTGPLKGETMSLVGHADPRGDEEYNLALGQKRSDTVMRVITGFGLAKDHVQSTSRGEADATGTDETSWAADRKVEVKLVESSQPVAAGK